MERLCVTYVLAWWCLLDKASQLQKARLDSTSSCYVNNIQRLCTLLHWLDISIRHRSVTIIASVTNKTVQIWSFESFIGLPGIPATLCPPWFFIFKHLKKADIFGEPPLTTIKHWNDLQVGARPGKKKLGQILTLETHSEAIDAKL